MKKIVKVIFVLTKCRFDFKLIKKERLLVFDTLSLELVSKLKKFEVLDVRYKVFNFWILLENFLQFKFTFRDYILTFISYFVVINSIFLKNNFSSSFSITSIFLIIPF